MGDVGDYWNDVRDYRREQKRKREPFNDELVRQLHKIAEVEELSPDGPHLRVAGVLDFWPSTGTKQAVKGADTATVEAATRLVKRARKATFKARGQQP